jgi:hypothetical protein
MSRLERFYELKEHAWFGKRFAKLKTAELEICEGFIMANESLSQNDFEIRLNSMFLDKEKPRNWELILDLLANANVVR